MVGADGANSRVRHWANRNYLPGPAAPAIHSAAITACSHRTDRMEIHWGKTSQAYVTGVNDQEFRVAVASHDPKLRLDKSLQHFPGIEFTPLRRRASFY